MDNLLFDFILKTFAFKTSVTKQNDFHFQLKSAD